MKAPILACFRSLVLLSLCGLYGVGCWPAHGPSSYVKIHQCAMTGDLAGVAAEVARDPRLVNLPEDYGQTPLHLAAQNCHSNVVAFLLSHNATVDARGSDNETPLHLAAQEGCIDVVTLLLNGHAAINAKDKEGRTPLKRAEDWERPAVADMLKERGGTE